MKSICLKLLCFIVIFSFSESTLLDGNEVLDVQRICGLRTKASTKTACARGNITCPEVQPGTGQKNTVMKHLRHLLTAAHCISGVMNLTKCETSNVTNRWYDTTYFTVLLGRSRLFENEADYTAKENEDFVYGVKQFKVHNRYSKVNVEENVPCPTNDDDNNNNINDCYNHTYYLSNTDYCETTNVMNCTDYYNFTGHLNKTYYHTNCEATIPYWNGSQKDNDNYFSTDEYQDENLTIEGWWRLDGLENLMYDIAIVELDREIPASYDQPNGTKYSDYINNKFTWEEEKMMLNTSYHYVEMGLVMENEAYYSKLHLEAMCTVRLCLKEAYNGTCTGDSGSGVLFWDQWNRAHIWGVVSNGPACITTGGHQGRMQPFFRVQNADPEIQAKMDKFSQIPGMYTDTTRNLAWICQNTGLCP